MKYLLVLLAMVLAGPMAAMGAGYVKIEGIKGESSAGRITITEVKHSVYSKSRNNSGAGRTMAKPVAKKVVVKKAIDTTTPDLVRHVMQNRIVPKVEIVQSRNGSTYVIELTNARISAVTQEAMSEEVSFAYQKISWKVSNSSGTKEYEYSIKDNK